MDPTTIVALVGAVMTPISGMFALYIRANILANKRRDKQDEKLDKIVTGLAGLHERIDQLDCQRNAPPAPRRRLNSGQGLEVLKQ